MSTFYALVILLFTKDGPTYVSKLYDSSFNCQVAEGLMLTKARDDKNVVGWTVPAECAPQTENIKS